MKVFSSERVSDPSDNPKSKIAKWVGLFAIVSRVHGVRSEGRGAADRESLTYRPPGSERCSEYTVRLEPFWQEIRRLDGSRERILPLSTDLPRTKATAKLS